MIVEVQIPDIRKIKNRMAGTEGKAGLAISRAINNTIKYATTLIVNESKAKYAVKAGDVKKTLLTRRARPQQLYGEVSSTSKKKVKLYGFKVSPAKPNYIDPPEVYKSKVLAESGMAALTGSGDRSKGFVTKMRSGHVGVFQRQTDSGSKGNQPIAELFGPSIPSMIRSQRVSKEVLSYGQSYLRKQVDIEISAIMRGYAK